MADNHKHTYEKIRKEIRNSYAAAILGGINDAEKDVLNEQLEINLNAKNININDNEIRKSIQSQLSKALSGTKLNAKVNGVDISDFISLDDKNLSKKIQSAYNNISDEKSFKKYLGGLSVAIERGLYQIEKESNGTIKRIYENLGNGKTTTIADRDLLESFSRSNIYFKDFIDNFQDQASRINVVVGNIVGNIDKLSPQLKSKLNNVIQEESDIFDDFINSINVESIDVDWLESLNDKLYSGAIKAKDAIELIREQFIKKIDFSEFKKSENDLSSFNDLFDEFISKNSDAKLSEFWRYLDREIKNGNVTLKEFVDNFNSIAIDDSSREEINKFFSYFEAQAKDVDIFGVDGISDDMMAFMSKITEMGEKARAIIEPLKEKTKKSTKTTDSFTGDASEEIKSIADNLDKIVKALGLVDDETKPLLTLFEEIGNAIQEIAKLGNEDGLFEELRGTLVTVKNLTKDIRDNLKDVNINFAVVDNSGKDSDNTIDKQVELLNRYKKAAMSLIGSTNGTINEFAGNALISGGQNYVDVSQKSYQEQISYYKKILEQANKILETQKQEAIEFYKVIENKTQEQEDAYKRALAIQEKWYDTIEGGKELNSSLSSARRSLTIAQNNDKTNAANNMMENLFGKSEIDSQGIIKALVEIRDLLQQIIGLKPEVENGIVGDESTKLDKFHSSLADVTTELANKNELFREEGRIVESIIPRETELIGKLVSALKYVSDELDIINKLIIDIKSSSDDLPHQINSLKDIFSIPSDDIKNGFSQIKEELIYISSLFVHLFDSNKPLENIEDIEKELDILKKQREKNSNIFYQDNFDNVLENFSKAKGEYAVSYNSKNNTYGKPIPGFANFVDITKLLDAIKKGIADTLIHAHTRKIAGMSFKTKTSDEKGDFKNSLKYAQTYENLRYTGIQGKKSFELFDVRSFFDENLGKSIADVDLDKFTRNVAWELRKKLQQSIDQINDNYISEILKNNGLTPFKQDIDSNLLSYFDKMDVSSLDVKNNISKLISKNSFYDNLKLNFDNGEFNSLSNELSKYINEIIDKAIESGVNISSDERNKIANNISNTYVELLSSDNYKNDLKSLIGINGDTRFNEEAAELFTKNIRGEIIKSVYQKQFGKDLARDFESYIATVSNETMQNMGLSSVIKNRRNINDGNFYYQDDSFESNSRNYFDLLEKENQYLDERIAKLERLRELKLQEQSIELNNDSANQNGLLFGDTTSSIRETEESVKKLDTKLIDTEELLKDLSTLFHNLSARNLDSLNDKYDNIFNLSNKDELYAKLKDLTQIKNIIKQLTRRDLSLGDDLIQSGSIGEEGISIVKSYIPLLEKLGYTLGEIQQTKSGTHAKIIPIDDNAITNGKEMAKILLDINNLISQPNKSDISLVQESSGQMAFFDDVIEKEERIQEEVKETNAQLEGQISIFDIKPNNSAIESELEELGELYSSTVKIAENATNDLFEQMEELGTAKIPTPGFDEFLDAFDEVEEKQTKKRGRRKKSEEPQDMGDLEQKVNDVSKAVENKNDLFNEEKKIVHNAVVSEVKDLAILQDALNGVNTTTSDINSNLNNINHTNNNRGRHGGNNTPVNQDFEEALNNYINHNTGFRNTVSQNLSRGGQGFVSNNDIDAYNDEETRLRNILATLVQSDAETRRMNQAVEQQAQIWNTINNRINNANAKFESNAIKDYVKNFKELAKNANNMSASLNLDRIENIFNGVDRNPRFNIFDGLRGQLQSELNDIINDSRIANSFRNQVREFSNNMDFDTTDLTVYRQQVIDAINQIERFKTTSKNVINQAIKDDDIDRKIAEINRYLNDNSSMANKLKKRFKDLELQYNALKLSGAPREELDRLDSELNKVIADMYRMGKTGKSVWAQLGQQIKSKTVQYLAQYLSLQDIIRYGREAFNAIHELDTALVDLKKTTSMNNQELESFYMNSNDVAKQMGVTTQEIISQAAAWSRLGYSTKEEVETMSKLSSQFASISPGVDVDTAQEGLVSAMKGFGIDVVDVEREIMDNINKIGNTMATSNGAIIDMLERSSAAMKAANNDIRETIALEAAAVEVTQNAESTGKIVPLNIVIYYETNSYIG